MVSTEQAIVERLTGQAIGQVRAANAADTVAGVQPAAVVTPTAADEVATLLKFANEQRLTVLVRGGGTQLTLGYPPAGGDILLDMTGLNQLIEHEPGDMTASAEAGMRLVDFQQAVGQAGQWLALDPALPAAATIGGLVATAASGPRRLRYGGVRDQIIGVQIIRADGVAAKGGGKVVKNVAGFDLPKLLTGSLGTLGVIVGVTFRLYPHAPASCTVVLPPAPLQPWADLAVRLLATTLVPSAIDLVGQFGSPDTTLAVRFEGSAEATVEQAAEVQGLIDATAGAAEVLSGEAETAYWQAAAAGPAVAGATTVRLKVSLLPTTIADWLSRAQETAERLNLTGSWRAHAGHGLLDVALAGEPVTLRAAVADLRAVALGHRGSLVVSAATETVLPLLDPWGNSPALELMQRVKAQFDPQRILNPGRFVGRI